MHLVCIQIHFCLLNCRKHCYCTRLMVPKVCFYSLLKAWFTQNAHNTPETPKVFLGELFL